ncbi:MAG: hypothetical protein I8H77_13595 [Comamonadaceae bacterium]|nr:hypothetical protein [Comamonadaceae bacterium]
MNKSESEFERLQAIDLKAERRIAKGEVLVLLLIVLLSILYWRGVS